MGTAFAGMSGPPQDWASPICYSDFLLPDRQLHKPFLSPSALYNPPSSTQSAQSRCRALFPQYGAGSFSLLLYHGFLCRDFQVQYDSSFGYPRPHAIVSPHSSPHAPHPPKAINALNFYFTLCMAFLAHLSMNPETNALKVSIIKTAASGTSTLRYCRSTAFKKWQIGAFNRYIHFFSTVCGYSSISTSWTPFYFFPRLQIVKRV